MTINFKQRITILKIISFISSIFFSISFATKVVLMDIWFTIENFSKSKIEDFFIYGKDIKTPFYISIISAMVLIIITFLLYNKIHKKFINEENFQKLFVLAIGEFLLLLILDGFVVDLFFDFQNNSSMVFMTLEILQLIICIVKIKFSKDLEDDEKLNLT